MLKYKAVREVFIVKAVEKEKMTSIILKEGEQIKVIADKKNGCIIIKYIDGEMSIENVVNK